MDDVITLSDDDDVEILTPSPAVLQPLSSTDNNAGMNQGATVHISTVARLNLESLGIAKPTVLLHKKQIATHESASGSREFKQFRSSVPSLSSIPLQYALKHGKRASPSSAAQQSHGQSTSISIPTQRTRNHQSISTMSQSYKGHYMFEATEGYEPSRRSSRFNTKKIDGKFVCTYNPTSCYKLCGSVVGLINHIWAHVAYDAPLGPAKVKEVSDLGNISTMRNAPTVPLSTNSSLALLKMRTCEYCNVMFISLHKKAQHVTKCHLVQKSLSTTCNICELNFESAVEYQAHTRIHKSGDAPYNCQKCKFRTSVRKYFFEHFVDKHCNEALLCPICLHHEDLRPSTRRSKHIFVRSFVEHMRLHATGKQLQCKKCALVFNDRNKLSDHEHDHSHLNPLWQVHERPELHEQERERLSRRMKITILQRRFFDTPEGRRINDEVLCPQSEERLGYDLTNSGSTLYKCECGFNSYNGNRTASHFHKCRKAIEDIERHREVVRHDGDPKDELEMFAVYPQPTETEKETDNESLNKLYMEKDELTKLRIDTDQFEPIDDLLLLKMFTNSKDKSSENMTKCFETIMMNEDD